MNQLSTSAKLYLVFGFLTCGYFSAAAAGNWPGPVFGTGGGSSYGPGYYYSTGRSSGGFGGGGK